MRGDPFYQVGVGGRGLAPGESQWWGCDGSQQGCDGSQGEGGGSWWEETHLGECILHDWNHDWSPRGLIRGLTRAATGRVQSRELTRALSRGLIVSEG